MSRSLADVDRDALSPEGARVLDEIAWKIAVDDLKPAEIAARLGMTTREITAAMDFLACEIEAQLGGAILPDLDQVEYEVLRDDIAARGQLAPIIVTAAGTVVDGATRIRVCKELGVEPVKFVVDLDETTARETALALQLGRRQLTTAQKRKIIRVELLVDATRSNREIARLIGVDDKTVGAVRQELEQLKLVLRNFRTYDAGAPVVPIPAKPKTVKVDQELYLALADVAEKASAYYGTHEEQHREPELEEALRRWHVAKGDEEQAA